MDLCNLSASKPWVAWKMEACGRHAYEEGLLERTLLREEQVTMGRVAHLPPVGHRGK